MHAHMYMYAHTLALLQTDNNTDLYETEYSLVHIKQGFLYAGLLMSIRP